MTISFATRLADIRGRLDQPDGTGLRLQRLHLLDGITDEMEEHVDSASDPERPIEDPSLVEELERMVDFLGGPWVGTAPEAQGRRVRLVELLRRADRGRLPLRAFDPADAFGADMQTMLATDAELRETLGRLFPLAARATAVAPSARWVADARAALPPGDPGTDRATAAIQRTLAALVRADIVSRPDLLVGGVRLINQRLARGLLWLAAVVLPAPAGLLGAVGLRMGTSGRRDAVVRDTALANTCAALLGASSDPAAPAALGSMRVRVTNRNVLKQVDRALDEVAARSGMSVEDVVELALPTFDLDEHRRVEVPVGDARAVIEVVDDGEVRSHWLLPDGARAAVPPAELAAAEPGAVAAVATLVREIETTVVEERRRMEDRLASTRAWPESTWRARFYHHPIGGLFGRRLIWTVSSPGGPDEAAMAASNGWQGLDGQRSAGGSGTLVRLWHPVDADPADVMAWQGQLVTATVQQPVRQVDRERFRPLEADLGLAADRRFAGRVVDHGKLRAILRQRGWATPFVGSWDQGEEATAWRAFDDGLRAELHYQAVERLATGERHERVRLVAVRFVHAPAAAPAAPAATAIPVRLEDVPPRVFSEAIRDVSLVVTVAEGGSTA
ncbi:MAG TPA: DUF4132 domain-containing protein [Candidatus Limnocylindrales bacterium]|nr:DUF4132 domain-containing protein [Candidatus Limnocylindrales bacterium]